MNYSIAYPHSPAPYATTKLPVWLRPAQLADLIGQDRAKILPLLKASHLIGRSIHQNLSTQSLTPLAVYTGIGFVGRNNNENKNYAISIHFHRHKAPLWISHYNHAAKSPRSLSAFNTASTFITQLLYNSTVLQDNPNFENRIYHLRACPGAIHEVRYIRDYLTATHCSQSLPSPLAERLNESLLLLGQHELL